MAEMVKIYNVDAKTISEIPKAELAPGMMAVRMKPFGEVWISTADLGKLKSGEYQHASLSPDFRKRLKVLQKVFREVMPQSLEQWVDNFRRDAHPDRELQLWEKLAPLYVRFTRNVFSHQKKAEVFDLLIKCTTTPLEDIPGTVEYKELTAVEIARIIEAFSAETERFDDPEVEKMVETVCDILSLTSHAEARRVIEKAEVIIAINPEDENDKMLLFGHELLNGIANGSIPPRKYAIMNVRIKPKTERCDILHAFIEVIKKKLNK